MRIKERYYLAGVAQWVERELQLPFRAHAWLAGQIPSGVHVRGKHTLMFVSLSFSLPSPLKINKISKKLPPPPQHLEKLTNYQSSVESAFVEPLTGKWKY